MSKKQGVKRGSAAHNQYMTRMIMREEDHDRNIWWSNRQFCLDAVVIALGELLEEQGKSQEEIWDLIEKFSDKYVATEREIAYMVHSEAEEEATNHDKVGCIWLSKKRVDAALKQFVRPELFVDFETRYYDCPPPEYSGKDDIIIAQRKIIDKREDEITRLKGQLKLMKVKNNGKV